MGFWDSLGSGRKKKRQPSRTPVGIAEGVDTGRGEGAAARPRALSLSGDTTRRRAEKQQPGSPADLHLLRHPSLVLPSSRPLPHVGPRSLEDSWKALQNGGASGSAAGPAAAAKLVVAGPVPALPRIGSEPAALREAGAEPARASVASVASSSTLSTDSTPFREAGAAPRGGRFQDFFQADLRDSRRTMKQASIVKAMPQAKPNLAQTSASSGGSLGPRPRAYRLSAASNPSSSSWDRLGNLEDGLAQQSSGGGGVVAGRPSLLHLAQSYLRRRPSCEPAQGRVSADGPLSIVSGGNDLQATMSMSSQLLDAALDVMADSHQRSAFRDSLAAPDLNKRITWMNKVLGSVYLDDHADDSPDEGEVQNNVLFHPHSPFRARWDLLVILVIVYQVAVMPVRVVWGDNKPGMLMYIEMVMSGILLLDVLLSFNTGFLSEGGMVMDKSQVRRHFALGWFVPDLASSLPYDALALLAMNADKHSPKAIGLRATRLLALLRWPRLWKYVQRWEELLAIDSVVLRIGKYWLAIIMFVHTVACLQVLEAYLEKGNLSSFLQRALIVNGAPTPSLMGRGPFVQYSYAIFRTQANNLACGWGVDTMQTFPELWVVLATEFFGSLFQLVFQASIVTTIRIYDRSGAEYLQRMEMLRGFFARHRLPKSIRARALDQSSARHPNRRMMREDALLRDMTPNMRGDLLVHQARDVLRGQPIFSAWQEPATRAVACEMVQAVFAPGDTIFHKGDSAECMYFVAHGVVRLADPDTGKVLTRISTGSYFGEFALLQGQNGVRSANAVSLTTTSLFSLSNKSVFRIAAHYPEIMESLVIVAAAREAMNRDQKVFSGDLLRIKDSRASFLMNTCRAAVAEGIAEGDEENTALEEEMENS